MKKVLVTGASGFIGGYVIDELLQKGYQVIATSADKKKALQKEWYSRVDYINFDFQSYDERKNYFEFFEAPDLMLHLAWEGLPNYKEDFHITVNFPRHSAFLQNLVRNGLSDITVTGTCFEYGMAEGCLTEDGEYQPIVPYAIAKDELRKKLQLAFVNSDVNFKWLRLFYMYGEGQSAKSLISQIDAALEKNDISFNMSGGEQERDFLPVEVMAKYIVEVATQQKIDGIINCCSGIPMKVKDFIQKYLEQRGKHIALNLGYYDYPDYEPMRFWGDTKKLKSILENE